ncbi:MAG: hypothetical protein IT373_31760 [Polyangiaceae bacterium]|nr:hypothetical protein [Polyangiaceae bacterium]
MGSPAAKKGDPVVGVDTHVVLVASPGGPVPTPMPLPFNGPLSGDLSTTVVIDDAPAALDGSTADNAPAHVPAGGPFQTPPATKGTVEATCTTVLVDNRALARGNDPALTCNDPADAPNGVVVASSTILVGD